MRYLLIGVAVLLCVIIVVVVIGLLLPVSHRATRTVAVALPRPDLSRILVDVADYPQWRRGLNRVELLEPSGRGPRYREISGGDAIEYQMDSSAAPEQLTTTIVGGVRAFGGTWTYDLREAGDITWLTITEDGKVFNPVVRFVSRFVMGHHATIDRFLEDVEKRVAAGR